MAETPAAEPKIQHFSVSGTWKGDGMGCGTLTLPQGSVVFPIGGARELGGCGVGANPEEILLAAVAACFLNTWAIFLKKLQVDYPTPSVRVTGDLGPDPAGGFKMLSATVHAAVPRSLLAGDREKVEKTVRLTEKYCITSKVARAAMSLHVVVEEM
ncbi:MAG TPA: OsmC family protein [Thermoanaerobaculia bacterium]|nr:OsmC family protein [Thermoanaerobaculia bacterium]